MPKVLGIREENKEEKTLREWFEAQKLEAPKALEDAARLLVGLLTGLLGALFGVLTVASAPLPVYLSLPVVRWAGALAVVLWLLSLLAGLVVLVPQRWVFIPGKPASLQATFQQIRAHKAWWLTACVLAFGLGVLSLGAVLIVAIFTV
ncbi:MAG: hypothetical protein RBS68_16240 [Anaerolineales bacterium]|jgi:hypothetical protein|nr:hypothetical protein [Anaerolineales bacterium]